ncbi:Galactose oxidase/kelch, beta-propeller [Corchorus capsularis]|uniref:Galactose oxidase/kelch, beta-propeller n=1 Tax=Corchorus capsularis TaxID=210143 RepID=A0A1R3IM84_COCAP|nr:Galactose oxidase/kelch, beta-propeller [Corchorus capsularis]
MPELVHIESPVMMPELVHGDQSNARDLAKEIVPCVESREEEEAKESNFFNDLPREVLSLQIVERLSYYDYNHFRAVNRICREVIPKKWWRNSLPLSPCLMTCKKGDSECQLIDPRLPKRNPWNNPNKFNDVRVCYSRDGWCVMLQGEENLFFWNPFTGEVIPIPPWPLLPGHTILGCVFSSSPDSPDCKLVLISDFIDVSIHYILVDGGDWNTYYAFKWSKNFKVSKNHNPVFYNEEVYLLDVEGKLGVFRKNFKFEVMEKPERPCISIYQSFLLEQGGKLLSVFVGLKGKWLRVFELNLSKMVWVEVDNLGDKTIYVSPRSSFSTAATMERMKNKTFCDIADMKNHVPMKSIPELRRRLIYPCSHGWLLLWEEDGDGCWLWNPVTLESKQLPSLALEPNQCIDLEINNGLNKALEIIAWMIRVLRRKIICSAFSKRRIGYAGRPLEEVTGVEVFKLNLVLGEWTKESGLVGNCIYFTVGGGDQSLYSFNMEDNSVSMFLPHPNLKAPWRSPRWIMPELVHREPPMLMMPELVHGEPNARDLAKEIVPCVEKSRKKKKQKNQIFLMTFLERICREVIPKKWWRNCLPLSPWLMTCKKGDSQCQVIDPRLPNRILWNNPNEFNDVRMCYSRDGWCVMLQGEENLFFWNPFTGEVIQIPQLPLFPGHTILGCVFSSSPDSPDCKLVLILEFIEVYIHYILVGGGDWSTYYAFKWLKNFKVSKNHNPVFYNEEVYLLDVEGRLGVFRKDFRFEILEKLQRPNCISIFYQSFLLEQDGKLLSVFVGLKGKWLRVFKLNLSTMVWVEVDNLGDKTIYVSPRSSFSTAATMERMKNKKTVMIRDCSWIDPRRWLEDK